MKIGSEEIKDAHYSEYFEKASAVRKGFLGFNRLASSFVSNARRGPVGKALLMGLEVISVALFPVNVLVTASIVGPSAISTVLAHFTVKRDAKTALDRDLLSGELDARYAVAILQPKRDALSLQIESLAARQPGLEAKICQSDQQQDLFPQIFRGRETRGRRRNLWRCV